MGCRKEYDVEAGRRRYRKIKYFKLEFVDAVMDGREAVRR